ncbi:MAG: TRAP transporter substrate-binding protein DctP [Planctomycetes bacterium]|nr:TRAP transporter substrate-binding protein DctP [Planctomycetota bacterium]
MWSNFPRRARFLAVLAVAIVTWAGSPACNDSGSGEGGAGAAGRKMKLVLAHVLPEAHPVHKAMVRFGEIVGEKSGGRITVTVRGAQQVAGSEKELIQKVKQGDVHLIKTSATTLESHRESMGVWALPFLFRDREHYDKVVNGEAGARLLDDLAEAGSGMRGVGYFEAGARSFYFREKVNGAAALVGRSIRVQKSPVMIKAMGALGMKPQDIDWDQVIVALQNGRVDGAENNLPSFVDADHYKYCKYYWLDEHTRAPDVLVMNDDVWKMLTADDQKMVRLAAREAAQYHEKLWQEAEQRALRTLLEHEVLVTRPTDEDLAALREKAAPVYQEVSARLRSLADEIRAVK